MSEETPLKRRRATIFVTGPNSKRTIYNDDDLNSSDLKQNSLTIQDMVLARQRMQNDLTAVSTANSIEVLIQIFMDEFEMIRHNLRENGARMRRFIGKHFSVIRQFIIQRLIFKNRNNVMLEYKQDADVILNQTKSNDSSWIPPKYTINELEQVLLTDDLEDGVIQRRTEKWKVMPIRVKSDPIDDSYCEFQRMNVPMAMTFEDEDDDRLSMPSTRTVMTTEDQMNAIQAQLAMLSKQLLTLQKSSSSNMAVREGRLSRASSRKGGRKAVKKGSLDIPTSSSSDTSEDEGKGPSVCSPSLSSQSKVVPSKESQIDLPPILAAPPPPPPPPPANFVLKPIVTPQKIETKSVSNSTSSSETSASNRPYLTDIANGRSLLKKTARSPGGSPMSNISQRGRRPISSFEAALRDRFRGFHGDASFSEQEENDDDGNNTWDE